MDRTTRRSVLSNLLVNVAAPIAVFYGLRALGASAWWALTLGAVPPAIAAVAGLVRRRRIDGIGAFTVAILLLSVAVSLLTGSPRFLLAKDGWLTAAGGIGVLATLVHLNAGIGGPGTDFDAERYRRTVSVNLDGAVYGMWAAIPAMAASGGGAIVVTSSMAGIAPAPFDPIYSATKHALIGLVRSVALAVADTGVTVDAVCPGLIDTPLVNELRPHAERLGWAIADPDLVARAVEEMAADKGSGRAWVVQAGTAFTPVGFPRVEMSQR